MDSCTGQGLSTLSRSVSEQELTRLGANRQQQTTPTVSGPQQELLLQQRQLLDQRLHRPRQQPRLSRDTYKSCDFCAKRKRKCSGGLPRCRYKNKRSHEQCLTCDNRVMSSSFLGRPFQIPEWLCPRKNLRQPLSRVFVTYGSRCFDPTNANQASFIHCCDMEERVSSTTTRVVRCTPTETWTWRVWTTCVFKLLKRVPGCRAYKQ